MRAKTVMVVSFAEYPRHPLRAHQHSSVWHLLRNLKSAPPRIDDGAWGLGPLDSPAPEPIQWFGMMGALVLRLKRNASPAVLVPIPNSECTWESPIAPRTLRLAQSIAVRAGNAIACDSLRWRVRLKPSHLGGPRDTATLSHSLCLAFRPPPGSVVLVDDVLTTGAHILAAVSVLSQAGIGCCDAICLARVSPHSGALRAFSVVETPVEACPTSQNLYAAPTAT